MYENYIFSGYGHSFGDYSIDNKDLEEAVNKGLLTRFDHNRIAMGKSYAEAKAQRPDLSTFDFMAELKMGFKKRNHVVPFPPKRVNYKKAKNALDLAVESTQMALDNAGIKAEEVSAWLVSTATSNEQAPGLAATLKGYFVDFENTAETMTLTSACGGFNYNLERAVYYFKNHPEAQHLVICHTEVMSELLLDTTEFVPFVTFADGAATVILSKRQGEQKEGIVSFVNYEDPKMINFLGATAKGRMYMQAGMVKNRATANLIRNAKEVLELSDWTLNDVDLMIPHQTGNAIVHSVIKALDFDFSKVYQDLQYEHGNLSGASIPASMSLLSRTEQWQEGQKILTATAGLGGETGAFTYIIPKQQEQAKTESHWQNKWTLITGASGGIGEAIAQEVARRGGNIFLHYFSNTEKAEKIALQLKQDYGVEVRLVKANFVKPNEVDEMIKTIQSSCSKLDYLVHSAGTTGSLLRASEVELKEFEMVSQINYKTPIAITKALFPILSGSILYIGSVAEDAAFPGSVAYVSSKRALHGFAVGFAQEALAKGVRSIYYMPGIVDGGMARFLDDNQKNAGMMAIGQTQITSLEAIANRIVNSLYIPKVQGVNSYYEDVLTVRRDAYDLEQIHYSIE